MQESILIIVRSFPFNFPMAIRMRSFIKIFEALGCETSVLCCDYTGNDQPESDKHIFEKTSVYSVPLRKISKKKSLRINGFKKTLNSVIETQRPSVIFTCSLQLLIPTIFSASKRYGIPVILESSEWYDSSTFKFGRIDIHYLAQIYCMRFYYPKADGVIAISELLYNHYKKYTHNVIKVTSIMDVDNENYRVESTQKKNDCIILIFAGSLARTKDSIKEYYQALDLVNDNNRIKFKIIGVREKDFIAHLGPELYEKYKDRTELFGRVHQSAINNEYLKSTFGIFYRPKQRSSNAGFSTKLAEGMTAGTPFIVNPTGDIPIYLHTDDNAFIVKDIDDIRDVYDKVLSFSDEDITRMRIRARKTAEECFNYKSYIEPVRELLELVKGSVS